MLSRLVVLLSAALLASACTAPSTRTAAAPEVGGEGPAGGELAAAAGNAAAVEEKDPVVCETITRTGTRVSERVCMRRSVAEKKARAGQEMLEGMQRRGAQVNPTSE